jgi:very-short-patch-repair endonuclease
LCAPLHFVERGGPTLSGRGEVKKQKICMFKIVQPRKSITELCRELRQRQTEEEQLLWFNIRNRWFKGYKFRRQHPFVYMKVQDKSYFFIADFYCDAKKLIIELDGKYHDFQKHYDENRDAILAELGLKTLRIKNEELKDMWAVRRKISEHLR